MELRSLKDHDFFEVTNINIVFVLALMYCVVAPIMMPAWILASLYTGVEGLGVIKFVFSSKGCFWNILLPQFLCGIPKVFERHHWYWDLGCFLELIDDPQLDTFHTGRCEDTCESCKSKRWPSPSSSSLLPSLISTGSSRISSFGNPTWHPEWLDRRNMIYVSRHEKNLQSLPWWKKSSSFFGVFARFGGKVPCTAFVAVASNEASYTLPWPSLCTNGSSSMSTPSNMISWVKHGTLGFQGRTETFILEDAWHWFSYHGLFVDSLNLVTCENPKIRELSLWEFEKSLIFFGIICKLTDSPTASIQQLFSGQR